MELKTEYCVRRDGKIWFNCTSENDAVDTAAYYNSQIDKDVPQFIPCVRQITEWEKIETEAKS